jgi:SulP family sulfate permease
LRVLPGLTLRNSGREALAGVTLLAIAVPLNIGYAQIAGLPATAGLYALILPSVVYALVVSSRQLVASPDAAAAALVASSLGGLAVAGSDNYLVLAFAQAIMCGVIFILCSVFKLGFLASFLSKPILVGFVGGLALDILVSQVAKMLGVKINSGGEFVEKVGDLFAGLHTANGWSILISVGSIVVLVAGRRIAPVVPWALIVLVVSTLLVVTTNLEADGVAVLGAVKAGPPKLDWPILPWSTWLQLVPSAIALTLVTMA